MTLEIQIVVIVITILAALLTFFLIRKGKLGLKISMPWLIVFLFILIFAIFPKLMDGLAFLLGIYDPLNMIFFLAIIFLMLIIYSLTMTVFANNKKTRDIIQKLGCLEEKLASMNGETEKKKEND